MSTNMGLIHSAQFLSTSRWGPKGPLGLVTWTCHTILESLRPQDSGMGKEKKNPGVPSEKISQTAEMLALKTWNEHVSKSPILCLG